MTRKERPASFVNPPPALSRFHIQAQTASHAFGEQFLNTFNRPLPLYRMGIDQKKLFLHSSNEINVGSQQNIALENRNNGVA